MSEVPSQSSEGPPIITVGELKAELSRWEDGAAVTFRCPLQNQELRFYRAQSPSKDVVQIELNLYRRRRRSCPHKGQGHREISPRSAGGPESSHGRLRDGGPDSRAMRNLRILPTAPRLVHHFSRYKASCALSIGCRRRSHSLLNPGGAGGSGVRRAWRSSGDSASSN